MPPSFPAPAAPPATDPIRVVVADDHAIVRSAVCALLARHAQIRVVAEVADGIEAVMEIERRRPDVALLDVIMPRMNGIEATRQLTSVGHPTRCLLLTAHDSMQHVKDALAAGAAGFVPKAAIADEVVRAIETAAAGSCYVHPSISTKLIQQLGRAGRGTDAVSELSVREREILRLLAVGYTNKEVAHQLGISVKTVETYKARAGEKLGLRSRVDLMNFAISHRWLGAPVVPA